MDIKKFCIEKDSSLLKALTQMDANHKGFLIVIELNRNCVVGTLTDGDIRRGLINGVGLNEPVYPICTKECHCVSINEGFSQIIELFKNKAIEFLPIVDENNRVVNVLTKKQMHTLLLMDKKLNLTDDFSKIDDNLMDYEIFPRPWGFYKTTVMNDYFQSKIISIFPGGILSLQAHIKREEYWIVAHGEGQVQLEESSINVCQGHTLFVPKGCKHRLANKSLTSNLIIIEVQIGEYFGEDDIIRYSDEYGRN